MPTYSYRCEKCDLVFQDLVTISKRNDSVDCESENCNGKANRDTEAELAGSSGCQVITDNEHWSLSMGVPASQVAEFRKKFPNSTYHDDGRLLVKNQKHKRKQGAERGMGELNDNCKAYFR